MDSAVKKTVSKSKMIGENKVPDKSSKMRMRIEETIRKIPKGKVSTYGAIARAA